MATGYLKDFQELLGYMNTFCKTGAVVNQWCLMQLADRQRY